MLIRFLEKCLAVVQFGKESVKFFVYVLELLFLGEHDVVSTFFSKAFGVCHISKLFRDFFF